MAAKKESGLKQLNSLFERYRTRLKAPEQVVLEQAVVVIDELLNIPITVTQLRYTPATRTLHITNGMLRSELLPHKKIILTHLAGRLGVQSAPTDII